MTNLDHLPVSFLRQRQNAHRSFGSALCDTGLLVESCPSCGTERQGSSKRYPEALYRDLDGLLEGARQAARGEWRGRRPCACCGNRIPSRTRSFVYAYHASRLRRDLLLVLRPGRNTTRPGAFLFAPGDEAALVPYAENLEELSSDLFHPAVIAFREARLALGAQNQPERTVALLEDATRSDPDFLAARTLLAEVLIGYGRIERAADHVEIALRLDKQDPEANLLKGRIEIARGKPGEARPYLECAVRSARTASAALYRLGLVNEDAGHDQEAQKAYVLALQLDPGNEGASERLSGLDRGVGWRFFHTDQTSS